MTMIERHMAGDHPGDWSSNLLAIGVFLGTALWSQWLLHREQRSRRSKQPQPQRRSRSEITNLGWSDSESWRPDLVDNDAEEEEAEGYQNRRFAGRMSFHEDSELSVLVASGQVPLLGRLSPVPSIVTHACSAGDGLFPKNSNWKHFEHTHSAHHGHQDRPRSLTDDLRSLSSEVASQNDLDGEDVSDSSSEVSANLSLTSNDHFVWTDARYSWSATRRRKKRNSSRHSGEGSIRQQQLPIALSERVMERAESIGSRLTSEDSLSRPTSPQPPQGSELSPLQDYNRTGEGRFRNSVELATLHTGRTLGKHASVFTDASAKSDHATDGLRDHRSSSMPAFDGGATTPPLPASMAAASQFRRTESEQIKHHNRNARALYNARIIPAKLILIRHAESMGNTNEEMYSTTPDNAMPLTKLGWEQARACGRHLKNEILRWHKGERVHFIVSPYVRTVETFHGIVSAWCDPATFAHMPDRDGRIKAWYGKLVDEGLTWQEDPRIREQDFGNFQRPEQIKQYKKDRHKFGAFYYRFPHGESASDVFDRISTFLDSLWRSFDMSNSRYFVLVTHGIAIRVLLARYFRYTIDQFNMLANPRNCEMILLEHNNRGRLEFVGRCEPCMDEGCDTEEAQILGFRYNKRLRVLPEEYVSHPKIRISYTD